MVVILSLFFVVAAALLGGALAKLVKVPSLVGYIIAGTAFGILLPENFKSASSLAEIGTILLLFSIGVELSFDRLSKFLKVAILGSVLQIVLVTVVTYVVLVLFGISPISSLILAMGFSLSSTAVVVKILSDKGELDTIHGGLMLGWLLIQDLTVIPIMISLPVLANQSQSWVGPLGLALAKAFGVVISAVVLGKIAVPYLVHKVAELNSRELLLLFSIALALGTAGITSLFGISPALGAFLAGVVISESQEHHAVFAETRPLRDLFVALFFVTLGFLILPEVIVSKFPLIITLSAIVILVKIVIVFFVSYIFGYKGKTGIANSFGLAQVGEFAFVIFSTSIPLKLLTPEDASLGISVTLFTLIAAPVLIGSTIMVWRKLKSLSSGLPGLNKFFSASEHKEELNQDLSDHIIICGFGRVGKWVGKALSDYGIPFVVIEYNQKVVNELKEGGIAVLYGDPTEPEVLEAVGIRQAKAVILAIPDRVAQETLIAYVQTVAPNVKIISRVHQDTDWEKLKTLRVDKIVQPEFEAALEIIRSVLSSRGKTREEISEVLKSLRVSHNR